MLGIIEFVSGEPLVIPYCYQIACSQLLQFKFEVKAYLIKSTILLLKVSFNFYTCNIIELLKHQSVQSLLLHINARFSCLFFDIAHRSNIGENQHQSQLHGPFRETELPSSAGKAREASAAIESILDI